MSTTVQDRDAVVTSTALMRVPEQLRGVVACAATTEPPSLVPATSVQTAGSTPAALMGLGTRALATALVVHSAPPGYLAGALASLRGDAAR